MKKIAITGNIASGKSEVEKIISESFKVFDADKIAHEVLDTIDYFEGLDVFTNGKIDRQKLAILVFNNFDIKTKLEKLIHPKVKEKIYKIFDDYKNEQFVFISIPLLYETGFDSLFDKVILVTIDENIQLKRLMKRNNLTKSDALKRMNSQLPQAEKIVKADFIIENNADIERLRFEVKKVIKSL